MSDRYKGAILSPTAPTVIPQSAGGVYTLSQQTQYQGQGVWPPAISYPINNSLRFRSSASAYLNRTPASAGNQTTWTLSLWFKRGLLTYGGSAGITSIFAWSAPTAGQSGGLGFANSSVSGAGDNLYLAQGATVYRITNAVLRDPSAWYHVVVVWDTGNATDADRARIYVNGVLQSYASAPSITLNATTNGNSTVPHSLGCDIPNGGSARDFFDAYLAEVNFIDGQALTPSSFGTTDAYGIWQPIPYTGSYGTNGFYLPFTDNSALTTSSNAGLGKDFSGNGNYWTTNNISITAGSTYDSMKDVPTNTNSNTANYCVLNPLNKQSNLTLSSANLDTSTPAVGTWRSVVGTVAITSGKWYWEATAGANGAGNHYFVGIAATSFNALTDNVFLGSTTDSWSYYGNNGTKYNNSSSAAYGASYTTNDVIGIAYDADAGTLTFYKNGTSQGTAFTGLSGAMVAGTSGYNGSGMYHNFGQRPFSYTPPSGFYPLNTYNLPTPTILAGNQYFNATTYTGNGADNRTISSSLTPDFVWMKDRSNAYSHILIDSVRGTGKYLATNSTNDENWAGNLFPNSGPTTNGFIVDGVSNVSINANGDSYVGWQWKANGSGSSNTQGTITSTVSANTTTGFSIVTGTLGAAGVQSTVGHGLGVAPRMIIFKTRSGATYNWSIYHASVCDTTSKYFRFTTDALLTYSTVWGASLPTSTVFGVTGDGCGSPSNPFVAYCFSSVAGYSAFGSYTGNGSTDGPFVYLGFRPRFVLIKLSSAAGANWEIYDSARNTYNATDLLLLPSSSSAEGTFGSYPIDLLSNGFKVRGTGSGLNDSGQTLIYAAFAENPFKIARAR